MKSSQEVIECLTAHLILSDYPEIQSALTALIIDAHRLHIINHLPAHEKEVILTRIKKNEDIFYNFVRNGIKAPLELVSSDR